MVFRHAPIPLKGLVNNDNTHLSLLQRLVANQKNAKSRFDGHIPISALT